MGRYLVLLVTGLMLLYSTVSVKMDQNRVQSAETNARSFSSAKAKNLSTSGAYMAVSKMALDGTWREGFSSLALGGAECYVQIDDAYSDASLSGTELLPIK